MNYPIVFDRFATDFTSHGLAVLEKAASVNISEVINGEYVLNMVLPRNDPKWQYLEEENFLLVDGQLFRLRTFDEIRDSTGKLTSNVQAEHVWYDANDCKFIPDFEMIGSTPTAILEAAFSGTRFVVGSVDASLANTDIMLSKTNPAAIVNKLVENVGGELVRNNWTISLKAQMGNNNGVQFRTGKNNVSIKKTKDTRDLATRLYPYGADDLDITSVNSGVAYLDSPYINNYDYIHSRYIDYSDIDDPTELKTKASAEFSTSEKDGIDKPKITYQVEVVELKKLTGYQFETFALGDMIRIIDEDLGIDVNARITEYTYYPYEPQRSNVVLANFKDNMGNLLVKLSETRSRLSSLLTTEGKVKVAWLENIMSRLQTEVEEGLSKKVAMHDYGDVWVDNIENPTKAIAIVDGMLAIANSKKENGDWNWRTFGTGDGFVTDLLIAGVIRLADKLTVENADGTVKLTSTGLQMTETDVARALFETGQIAMQVWDSSSSSWVNGLYFDTVKKKFVFNGELSAELITALEAEFDVTISNTTIVNNLYAAKGVIAELTVDEFDTSDKVQNYIDSNTADVNYIHGYNQNIEFKTATYVGDTNGQPTTTQLRDRNNNLVYWIDSTHKGTTTEPTEAQLALPVMMYAYNEVTKMSLLFEQVNGVYTPKILLGAGDGVLAKSAKGEIVKGQTGLELNYYKSGTGELRQVLLSDEGVVITPTNYHEATITTAWSGSAAPYYQDIAVSGINESDEVMIDVRLTGTYTTDVSILDAWKKVYRIQNFNNYIRVYAHETISVAIPIQLVVTI